MVSPGKCSSRAIFSTVSKSGAEPPKQWFVCYRQLNAQFLPGKHPTYYAPIAFSIVENICAKPWFTKKFQNSGSRRSNMQNA